MIFCRGCKFVTVKKFILQLDNVSQKEKMAISQSAILRDRGSMVIHRRSLAELKDARLNKKQLFNDKKIKEIVPVGSVEFCREWMSFVDVIEPLPMDYPKCLRGFMEREIKLCYYHEAIKNAAKFKPGAKWIKPAETKKWEAHSINLATEEQLKISRNDVVWYSDSVQFDAEWRCYFNYHQLVGIGRYDDFDNEIDEQPIADFSRQIARTAMLSGDAPRAYAVDVGYIGNSLVMVEFTDAWAIGLYKGDSMPVSYHDYADMIYDRWMEIIGN